MILKELLGSFPIVKSEGTLELDIKGISHDSRKIRNDFMFIARKGFNNDGHEFIPEAIEKGARVIVLERDVNLTPGITYIWVDDMMDFMGSIASRFYDYPQDKIFIIGVTGTNGKTSTTYFIKSIIEMSGKSCGIIGTTGVYVDNEFIQIDNTTPEPLELIEILSKLVQLGVKYCVMEVSSHALSLGRVKSLSFDIGIFTNLSKDHLDFHYTMENYFLSKLKLFYITKKYNIINIDDYYGMKILQKTSIDKKYLTYGFDKNADIYCSLKSYSITGTKFELYFKNENKEICLNVPGEFSVYNALAAISCGIALNIDLDIIKKGIEKVNGIKGRFEIVPINKDFTIIVDFAHTSDGIAKVLESINKISADRKIVVFGAGGDRDRTKRPEMGEVVGNLADYAIITSDNPRYEDPVAIIDDILIGVRRTKADYEVIIDRKKAIEHAIDIAKPNDIILVLGKGHENYVILENKKYPFDERQIILDYIKD